MVPHDKKRAVAKQVLCRGAICLGLILGLTTHAADLPDAQEIVRQTRLQEAQQQLDLQGQLRSEENVIPFHLVQNGPVIRYIFPNPPQTLQLTLGPEGSRFELVQNGRAQKLSAAQLAAKIDGTGVSYGDLALSFLYWPNPQMIGPDSVRTRACWKLRLHPPAHDGQYSTVILWVDRESGAIMRLEAYDWKNQLAKKFEVVSAQKIEGRWFLKQMRIEEMQPGTSKVATRSYLEINK